MICNFAELKLNGLQLQEKITQILLQYRHILRPDQEALWLLQHFKSIDSVLEVLTFSQKESELLNQAIAERIFDKKPLAYILRNTDFLNLQILCEPPILIPRSDTEAWVEQLILFLQPRKEENLRVLDLCCGTGCIGLAVAKAFTNFLVIGSDINPDAINLSRKNAVKNQVQNIKFVQSNLFDQISLEGIDVLISNPPYINTPDYAALDPQVKNWEDKQALHASNNGYFFYEQIIQKITEKNCKKLTVALEMDSSQINHVSQMLKDSGFQTKILSDLTGQERAIFAKSL